MRRQWNGRRLRDLRGATPQGAIAEAIGVHRTAVIAWEAGSDPSLRNAIAIADLFGVPLDSFIDEEPATAALACGSNHDDGAAAVRRSPVVAHDGG